MTEDQTVIEPKEQDSLTLGQQLLYAAVNLKQGNEETENNFLNLLWKVNEFLMEGRAARGTNWRDQETFREEMGRCVSILEKQSGYNEISIYLSDEAHRLAVGVDRDYPEESGIQLDNRNGVVVSEVQARWDGIKPNEK